MSSDFVRAHVVFRGRVQGVFFRAYTERWATELGLTGWVRNNPDGSVSAVIEGPRNRIEELIRRLKTKHPYAKVKEVELSWEPATGEFNSFRIVYYR